MSFSGPYKNLLSNSFPTDPRAILTLHSHAVLDGLLIILARQIEQIADGDALEALENRALLRLLHLIVLLDLLRPQNVSHWHNLEDTPLGDLVRVTQRQSIQVRKDGYRRWGKAGKLAQKLWERTIEIQIHNPTIQVTSAN